MNSLPNTSYSNILGSFAMGTALLLQSADSSAVESIIKKPKYDQYINYDTAKQSTQSDSYIQNDIEMLKILDITNINNKINTLFGTTITEHWIPADGILEETCLFIKVDKQESFMQNEDFELDLYLAVKDEIDTSSFFNMIALM